MHRARGRVCNRGEGYCIQRNFPKMNYTMAWIGCQATPIPLSLFRVNAFSNARIATVFVCITTALSRLVSRPLEYRGICKFWVELGQLTRARSNQRFRGGRERGKNGLAVFFFYIDTFYLFFFFYVEPGQKRDTWNLPLVVCISSTVTLCDREIYLGYKIHGGLFLSSLFFFLFFFCNDLQF